MNKEKLLEKMSNLNQNTMATAIGLELTDIGNDYVCGKIPVDRRTIQPFGFLHGGASVALAETIGSLAGQMQIDPEREIVLGIEINANHIKSVKEGCLWKSIANQNWKKYSGVGNTDYRCREKIGLY